MAEHDFVIDNGTGAAVRADINNVLQAIASNNSKSGALKTNFAFQWHVDTSDGLLKIRKEFDFFANYRPAIVFKELVGASSLKKNLVEELDILILRELTGDIYFGDPKGKKEINVHPRRGRK